MEPEKTIVHNGIIEEISNKLIRVKFISFTSCSECNAKSLCAISDLKDKYVEVSKTRDLYQVGEEVKIILQQSLGFLAVFWAYVLPFLLVILTLGVLTQVSDNELLTGGFSLAILIPYYLGLYLYKNKLEKKFRFIIKKLEVQ